MTKQFSETQDLLMKYVIGFLLSLLITLGAYFAVTGHIFADVGLGIVLGILAISQAVVQLYLFLHLDNESRPRLKFISLVFMLLVLVIVVAGSLWIMYHLNYNMMELSPEQKDNYLNSQRNKGF